MDRASLNRRQQHETANHDARRCARPSERVQPGNYVHSRCEACYYGDRPRKGDSEPHLGRRKDRRDRRALRGHRKLAPICGRRLHRIPGSRASRYLPRRGRGARVHSMDCLGRTRNGGCDASTANASLEEGLSRAATAQHSTLELACLRDGIWPRASESSRWTVSFATCLPGGSRCTRSAEQTLF